MQKATNPKPDPVPPPPQRRPALIVLPVIMFAALAAVFGYALRSGDPSRLPSALIGKPVPETAFPALEGLAEDGAAAKGIDRTTLADGRAKVVNFWASWCGPCIEEHPALLALSREHGALVYGINYKDKAADARRFLGRYGNPFAAVGTDPGGRGAIEWGVYGMPETFVIDGQGRIVAKHVGALTPAAIKQTILPALKAAGQR